MSSAKRRGQARGQAPDVGGSAPRRGPNPARGRVAPFDGPASRGSGSAAGTQSQVTGSAAGSRRGSNAGTQAPSQAGSVAGSQSQAAAQVAPIARDPAREGPVPRTTDPLRNVDMPASFYNIDNLVSQGSFFIFPQTLPTSSTMHGQIAFTQFVVPELCWECISHNICRTSCTTCLSSCLHFIHLEHLANTGCS